jgi:RNA polymerase sigma-B factor
MALTMTAGRRDAPRPADGGSAGGVDPRFVRFRESRDQALRNELVLDHRWLAEHCARRFAHRGEPVDDLVQVAHVGLVKAVERFDPEYGVKFAAFAVPTILGELKRHFRDATWPLRVPRRATDLLSRLTGSAGVLSQRFGRSPTVTELAGELQVTERDVAEALAVREVYRTEWVSPVDDDDGTGPARRPPTVEEAGVDAGRLTVRALLMGLPDEDQRLVYLRFYEGLTQAEIAARVGTSQVQVSRRLRRLFERLRDELPPDGPVADGDTGCDRRAAETAA